MMTVMNDHVARELLVRVGESMELEENVSADMMAFVLSKVYGESADFTCGQARASKWHKLKKKSTLCLPPDENTLYQHLQRTNYISYCQLNYKLLQHPSPIGFGWEILNGKCRPVRHTLPPLPQQFIFFSSSDDIRDDSGSEDERSECRESTDSDDTSVEPSLASESICLL